jgi:CubicO group peptidase (beta-lactamase class C family)
MGKNPKKQSNDPLADLLAGLDTGGPRPRPGAGPAQGPSGPAQRPAGFRPVPPGGGPGTPGGPGAPRSSGQGNGGSRPRKGATAGPRPPKKRGGRGKLVLIALALIAGLVGAQQLGLLDRQNTNKAEQQKTAPSPAAIACDQVDAGKVRDKVLKAAQDSVIKTGAAPSAAIVVGCGGKAITSVAVGSVNGKAPQIAGTRYDLASVTKLVVDTAIYRLAYERKLNLNDPVGKYLPAWKSGDKAKVTVAMLMNNTSGMLGEGNTEQSLLDEARAGIGRLSDPEAIERRIINMPLKYKPGTYHYSNLGYVVLYHVGGVAAGVPEQFNRYMKSALFTPLGMSSTNYLPGKGRACAPTRPYERPSTVITCHSRDLLARKTGEVGGHAGLFSTASDMSRLAMLLVNGGQFGGKRYLHTADVNRMRVPQSADNAYGSAVWTNSKGRFGGLTKSAFGGYGDTGVAVAVDPASHLWVVMLNNSSPTDETKEGKIKKAVATVNTAAIQAARGQ